MGFSKCLPCRRAFSSLPPNSLPSAFPPVCTRRQLASIFTNARFLFTTRSDPSLPYQAFYESTSIFPRFLPVLLIYFLILQLLTLFAVFLFRFFFPNLCSSLDSVRNRAEKSYRNINRDLYVALNDLRTNAIPSPWHPCSKRLSPLSLRLVARYGRVIYEHCICSPCDATSCHRSRSGF